MVSRIFVNLPVKDLERTKAFFAALGFSFEPRFTDENAACLILGETQYAMLLVESMFQTFTPKPVADATKSTEVLVALQVDSRAEVDEMVAKAVAAGATIPRAAEDHGFMYGHSFQDLDGHIWEPFWMDPDSEG
jgi:uncharacterized protein